MLKLGADPKALMAIGWIFKGKRTMQNTGTATLILKLAALTSAASLLTGCADYLARHDGVTFDAGDAAAYNAAVQMIDPWPRHSANNSIDIDGNRIGVAMKKYQTNDPDGGATGKKTNTSKAAPSNVSAASN